MKCIIIGMGSFGAALAIKLTENGNEVIGVDNSMQRVEMHKDQISHVICLDATDQHAISNLPIADSDIVIVAIGENQGANIMATAAIKNLNAKRLITRSVNPLQENVLLAMGLDEIINPEVESADRLAKKLCLTGLVDSFELDKDYSIVEIETPSKYINKTLEEINFRKNHNLVILTTIKKMNKSLLGISIKKKYVNGVATPSTILNKEDILVIYGHNKDIKNMLDS